jgi:mycothiol synthase
VFRVRSSARDDDQAVLRVLAARDLRDFGVADCTRGLLLDQWRVAEFDPRADAVVAVQDEAVVGYGALFTPGALGFVDPRHEGLGIGSALLAWVEDRARRRGSKAHRQPVARRNARAHALLEAAGYRQVRSVLKMARAIRVPPAVPPPPPGISLHMLDVTGDAEALHAADAAAFAGNPEFEPQGFDAFFDEHLGTPELDPELSLVARRGQDIAGFTICRRSGPSIGYVDLLAVDHGERRRGLGTVLLLRAFASFAAAGLHEAQLEVASDNPSALRLYERAGMTPRHGIDVFEKPEPVGVAPAPGLK